MDGILAPMLSVDLKPRATAGGAVTPTVRGWRFELPAGENRAYRLAQLDDYASRRRSAFEWKPSLTLRLRARVSSASIAGTWGFGLWNDPFGLACGPTMEGPRAPAFPQAAWFFSASTASYLSLRDDKPANGFFAQVLKSAPVGIWALSAAFTFPFSARHARRKFSRNIAEDAARVTANPCDWHQYQIAWRFQSTDFQVDDHAILTSTVSPRAPLGLVIWIDNQHASFDPRGKIRWGVESVREAAWLEIEDVTCSAEAIPS